MTRGAAAAARRRPRPSDDPGSKSRRPARRGLRAALLLAVLVGASTAFAADEASVRRGKAVFDATGCTSCHTDHKARGPLLAGGRALKTPFGTFHAPNITPDDETGIGGWSDEGFARALRQGLAPDGSHYFPAFPYPSYTGMTDRDVRDLKAYIFSLPSARQASRPHELSFAFRSRVLAGLWKRLNFEAGRLKGDRAQSNEWNRGAYLVRALAHCGECHTPRDRLGELRRDRALAGTDSGPAGGKIPNITPDPQTGIGGWSEGDIVSLLEIGMTAEGDFVGDAMGDVVEHTTSKLSHADRRAIAVYLKSVPAIRNEISGGG